MQAQTGRLGAGGLRLARCAGRKVARFGDNMREVAVTEGDKVEAQIRLGYSVNGYGVGDLVKCVKRVVTTPRSTSSWQEYDDAVRGRPSRCARAAPSAQSLARGGAHRAGHARFPGRRRLQGLHHHL